MGFVSPKTDFSIKELMENPMVRNHFISDALDVPVERIQGSKLRNTFLRRRFGRQKLGILDILAEFTDGTKVNIELQIRRQKDWDKRVLFYLAKVYVSELWAGDSYGKLKKCIHIGILDFNLTEDPEYHSVYKLRDQKGREFSDQLEIHVIELKKELTGKDRIDDWIKFFNAASEEELDMLSEKSIGLQEAVRVLRELSLTKRVRLIYEAHLKEVRDQKARDAYVWEEGCAYERANTEREREEKERERQRADLAEAENRRLRKELARLRKE